MWSGVWVHHWSEGSCGWCWRWKAHGWVRVKLFLPIQQMIFISRYRIVIWADVLI
jgi:hypothetical protein